MVPASVGAGPYDAHHVSAPGSGSSAAFASMVSMSSSWSSSAALMIPDDDCQGLVVAGY